MMVVHRFVSIFCSTFFLFLLVSRSRNSGELRKDCAPAGDANDEIESADIDLGRIKRGRFFARRDRSSGDEVTFELEGISGTEPLRRLDRSWGTTLIGVTLPDDAFR
jgi:hypothetical protein